MASEFLLAAEAQLGYTSGNEGMGGNARPLSQSVEYDARSPGRDLWLVAGEPPWRVVILGAHRTSAAAFAGRIPNVCEPNVQGFVFDRLAISFEIKVVHSNF